MNIKVNLRVVRVVLTLGLLSTGLLTRAADYRAPQAGNFVVKDFQFKSSEKLAMPLASQPIEIAGRNRMMRRMILDAIRNASDWNDGEYSQQPHGLEAALGVVLIIGEQPVADAEG